MRNYLIILILPLFFACQAGKKETTQLEDSLTKANEMMSEEINEKDTIINSKEAALSEFLKSFNEIQNNLNEIKAKEKILNTNKKGTELNKSGKDQIISDIQFIYNRMNKNREKLASVNKKLKDANIKIDELDMAIANLHLQITDNENEIANLKQQLEKLNLDFKNLQDLNSSEEAQLKKETELLNTAYYVEGTAKYLKDNGVITKEGGFIGIGKTLELNKNFSDYSFKKIDIAMVTEIPLYGAKKVKLITQHPTGSYKLIEGSGYEKLMITDVQDFWKASKYLVIETDKTYIK